MKYFSPIQKISLGVLSVIVVVMAIVAFATAGSLSKHDPRATPQVVVIELANTPTPSPVPIPMPEELQGGFATAAPTTTPSEPAAVPTGAAILPAAKPTSAPVTVSKHAAFALTIKGKTMEIANNVEEDTLEDGPGWLNTSAAPGQDGVCVVFGHRNRNHLKVLEKVDYGDTVTVTAKDGTQYDYKIESIEIVKSDAELRIPTLESKYLMLVTCYPFYYTGHAPQKYVVFARVC